MGLLINLKHTHATHLSLKKNYELHGNFSGNLYENSYNTYFSTNFHTSL